MKTREGPDVRGVRPVGVVLLVHCARRTYILKIRDNKRSALANHKIILVRIEKL